MSFVAQGVVAVYVYSVVWHALAVVALSVFGGMTPVLIAGGSMAPVIRPGDVALLEPSDGAGLGIGTVITFEDEAFGGRLLTHRIVGLDPEGHYVTKGDANAAPDSDLVAPRDIVGVGRVLVPFVGLPALWWREGEWLAFLAWLGLTVLAVAVLTPGRRRAAAAGDPGASQPDPDGWPPPILDPVTGRSAVTVLAALAALGALLGSGAAFSATTNHPTEVHLVGPGGAGTETNGTAVGGTYRSSCVARSDDTVWCWGLDDVGQLGDGTTTSSLTQVLSR